MSTLNNEKLNAMLDSFREKKEKEDELYRQKQEKLMKKIFVITA